jgi:glycosyltransferase involved in cell wall biosynthesis
MRALEIIADGDPGGGTAHVLQILRGFSEVHSLGLITQANSYLSKEAHSLGIKCFGVNFFRSRADARVPFELRKIVRKFEPQLVHVHGGRAGFFCALAAINTPIVYTVHGYHFPQKRPLLIRWLALNAERVASWSADRVLFVSNYDARVAQAHRLLPNLKQSVVVSNGISFAQIPRAKPVARKHIGFVGRLEYQKDPLLFLDVMERLPDYSATIVGGGALGDEVRKEIKHRNLSSVRMLGALPQSESFQELSKLHTVIMTSRWEGLPLLPLEAMWSGVPVVATNVGGLSEIIENEKSGLLINSRSADDLALAVMRLTDDLALRESIVDNARRRVQTLFSEARMLSEIDKTYQEVAAL